MNNKKYSCNFLGVWILKKSFQQGFSTACGKLKKAFLKNERFFKKRKNNPSNDSRRQRILHQKRQYIPFEKRQKNENITCGKNKKMVKVTERRVGYVGNYRFDKKIKNCHFEQKAPNQSSFDQMKKRYKFNIQNMINEYKPEGI